MNYLQNRQKPKLKWYIIFAITVLILIFWGSSVLSGLSAAAHFVFRPLLKIGQSESSNSVGIGLKSKKELLRENKKLKRELEEVKIKTANYDVVLSENNSLKEALGREEERDFVLGNILAKPTSSLFGTIVIDIGANKRVSEGDLVFADGIMPIGRIEEVFPNSSKVLLFSNPGTETEVIFGEDAVFMKLIGRGGGNFEVDVPRDFSIEEDQAAVLPGSMPYTVALVKTIISDPRDSFSKALFVTLVNIQNIKFVQVLR